MPAMLMNMLLERTLWSDAPPEPRSRLQNWSTVLFSWWCTSFATAFILTRLSGRKVRSNRLFREDWIMMISLIPLWIRMILIHFVLINGTNNIATEGHHYSQKRIDKHELGSKLVLAARIFFAMFIWITKLTVCEFLKRITFRVWRRSWEIMLQCIRVFLLLTFLAVVIATLAECVPFSHNWQVVPDPGPQCRQGYGNLLTMGTCDIVTDILLIAFPIPVVLQSGQNWKRKLQMMFLFSLSIVMIAITATRMPEVIEHHGRQQYRTVWASGEILAAAVTSNAVILGSFLRDKGTKKNKYRNFSVLDSVDRPSTRRPTLATLQTLDSDEDLFMTLASSRLPDHLQHKEKATARPAPPAFMFPSAGPSFNRDRERAESPIDISPGEGSSRTSDTSIPKASVPNIVPESPSTARSVNFFDAGNLLDDRERSHALPRTSVMDDEIDPLAVESKDFARPQPQRRSRSEARSFLREVGGRLRVRGEGDDRSSSPRPSHSRSRSRNPPTGIPRPALERHDTNVSLQDAGGLLGPAHVHGMASPRSPAGTDSRRAFGLAPPGGNSWSDDIELDDVGDLLSNGRTRDRASVSLQDMLSRSRSPQASSAWPLYAPNQQPDDMILHDPGGLTK